MDKDLKEITLNTDHETLIIWALDCAERILPEFIKKYPNDEKLKEAINAGRSFLKGQLKVGKAREFALSAHGIARRVSKDGYKYIARSCGQAVATIHVKEHAIHAFNYYVKASLELKGPKKAEEDYMWGYNHLVNLRKKY